MVAAANLIEKGILARRRITCEDYERMMDAGIFKPGERLELINGELIEMSPIYTPHSAHISKTNRYLMNIISDDLMVRTENPIQIGQHSYPEPDICVVKFREDYYRHQHPLLTDIALIAEVADSSLEYDRKVKAPLYANAGIQEYWIIDVIAETIEVYTASKGEVYQKKVILKEGDKYKSKALGIEIAVSDILVGA